jgi:GT2 family glycosyltransferase
MRNPANEGFARACNQGIAAARGAYLLLLNSDTRVAPDALGLLAGFLDEHEDYAAAAPRLLNPDGTTQRACMGFPSLATPLWYATPFERWFPDSRELRRYFVRGFDHETDADVDQPPAACLLLRRRALDTVGLLDEKLWLYFNDVDLSLRLARGGWRTRYLARACVLHHVGASTRQLAETLPEWHKNRLAYYRKHFGRAAGWWVKLCVTLAFCDFAIAQAARAVRGRPAERVAPLAKSFGRFLLQ